MTKLFLPLRSRWGRLVVIDHDTEGVLDGRRKYERTYCVLKCDCGSVVFRPSALVRTGAVTSCGCLQEESLWSGSRSTRNKGRRRA